VKPSRFSHWLRVSVLLVLCSFTAYACGGSQFTAVGSGGAGGADGGLVGDSGSSGAAGSSAKACQGPEDCDEGNPCIVDQCGADGLCKRAPKCDATQVCCHGTCGECCAKSDCDDSIGCTDDDCFAGACTHSPNNASCGADKYCTIANGCRKKESCTADKDCVDTDLCTDDTCTAQLCEHTPTDCGTGMLCCPGSGCAQCCEDSQCNDSDPCTTDKCEAGQCHNDPLCNGATAGPTCCPNADNTSATCGKCCSAAACDDMVDCTKDSCVSGSCNNIDDGTTCKTGFACDTKLGCTQTAQCLKDADCNNGDPCASGSCLSGSCKYENCVNGGTCCPGVGCRTCCGDAGCDDQTACTTDTCNKDGTCSHTPNNDACGKGLTCDPANGGCIQCVSDNQCDDGSDCTTDSCDLSTHKCVNKPSCGAKTPICCGTTCGACCTDNDCRPTGGVTTAAVGKTCPVSSCDLSTYTCVQKNVSCTLSSCCATGCCLISTQ
jgi:hypothetical protein